MRHGAVLAPLDASDVAPPAAIGYVPQPFDVNMDHRARVVVFVPPDRFTGGPVDVGQPVEDGVHGRGRHAQTSCDLHWPSRCLHRRCTILRTTGGGVLDGL
jgi:hypothetical protein